MTAYGKPCPAEFERLSESDPDKLDAWVRSGELDHADLSYALEWLGDAGPKYVPTLMAMLEHAEPLVREGAVYGLGRHVEDKDVFGALVNVARGDASDGVKEAAWDVVGP